MGRFFPRVPSRSADKGGDRSFRPFAKRRVLYALLSLVALLLSGCFDDLLIDLDAPSPVSGFMATGGDTQIALSWVNPTDPDLAGVLIRRSADTYPSTPTDGFLAYDGSNTSATDTGLSNETTFYYTAFAYDQTQNYNDGIQASATPMSVDTFTISGTVSGLNGTVVLQNNGGDDLMVSNNGGFTFATPIDDQTVYAVTVLTHPSGQTCSVASGTGTLAGADIDNVSVTCSMATYTVGGTVSGLTGTVVLQNNGGDDLTVSNYGGFTFATPIDDQTVYAVTVLTHPAGQTCSVTNGTGTLAGADIDNVSVTCSVATYTVGGTLSGLTGTMVLQNNGDNDLTINSNGPFTFVTPVADQAGYSVTVLTQPSGQFCAVTNGTGTINGSEATDVGVVCSTRQFTLGGTVAGLFETLSLQTDRGEVLEITTNGSFTFSGLLADGEPYEVTVHTAPYGQTCAITNGTGIAGAGDVTDVPVVCSMVFVDEGTAGASVEFTSFFYKSSTSISGTVGRSGASYFTTAIPYGSGLRNVRLTNLLSDADLFVYSTSSFSSPICTSQNGSTSDELCAVSGPPAAYQLYIKVVDMSGRGTSFSLRAEAVLAAP